MRLFRLMFVLWSWFLAYNICTVFFGKNGIYTLNHHQAEIVRLSENIENLKNTQNELIYIKKDFLNNPNTRSIYLQRYGYTLPDKKNMSIVGYNIGNNANRHSGEIVYAREAGQYFSDTLIKIIATVFMLFVLLSLFFIDTFLFKTNRLRT